MSKNQMPRKLTDHPLVRPTARPLNEFAVEEVGYGEKVLFDPTCMVYHTLNRSAFAVWKLCDGERTIEEISRSLIAEGSSLDTDAIELVVLDFADAGLLSNDLGQDTNFAINRRRILQFAAAGTTGAVIIPVVKSITTPNSASAATCSPAQCFGTNAGPCPSCPPGQSKTCASGCCGCS